MEEKITRGDLYFADLENQVIGSEQASNELFENYMLTLMEVFSTKEIEVEADRYR